MLVKSLQREIIDGRFSSGAAALGGTTDFDPQNTCCSDQKRVQTALSARLVVRAPIKTTLYLQSPLHERLERPLDSRSRISAAAARHEANDTQASQHQRVGLGLWHGSSNGDREVVDGRENAVTDEGLYSCHDQ